MPCEQRLFFALLKGYKQTPSPRHHPIKDYMRETSMNHKARNIYYRLFTGKGLPPPDLALLILLLHLK